MNKRLCACFSAFFYLSDSNLCTRERKLVSSVIKCLLWFISLQ
nr:MAG TPA: hypothetical protein [Caudoviricetes sp.]